MSKDTAELFPTIQLDDIYAICQLAKQARSWRPALVQILKQVRKTIIYDNVAVYLLDRNTGSLEVSYAKSVGRGRSSEADVAWGEVAAGLVFQTGDKVLQEPEPNPNLDRLEQPFILGMPLKLEQEILGAMVFIRFGGPHYTPEQIEYASFTAQLAGCMIGVQELKQQLSTVETLKQMLDIQGDLISILSHEIRNPLGFIKGYTSTLLRSDTEWDAQTQREFLTIIESETDRLERLLENLLDSARLESGQTIIKFLPVRLEALFNDMKERAKLQYPDMQIEVQIETSPATVLGDPRRLTQVFEYLLSNSAKYAPGSPVHINVQQMDQPKGILIRFSDSGPGIPEKHLPFIFERFFRNPEQNLQIYGTGLGLYIARQIVLAHHGRITATSDAGKGVTFHIFLPEQTFEPPVA